MTSDEVQILLTEARCDICNIPEGFIWEAILAALVDVANGMPVPTDPQILASQAACVSSCVPKGLVPYLILQAIRGISGGGSGALQVYQGRAPAAPDDPSKAALNYPIGGGQLQNWDIGSGQWT